MPTPEELDEQSFAILAVNDPDDTDAVFAGKARKIGDTVSFCNEEGDLVPVNDTWLARIKKTPEGVKDLLMDCDFVLKIEVGSGQPDQEAFAASGLTWPTECAGDDEDDDDEDDA